MNIFKKIFSWLFDKKDAIHPECQKVYDGIEEIKNSYKKINNDVVSMISDEEFRSLTTEQQKAVLEKEISDAELKMNIISGKPVFVDYIDPTLTTYTNNGKYDVELKNNKTGKVVGVKVGETINNLQHGEYTITNIIPEVKLDIVTSGYLRREDDPFPEKGILTTSSTSDKVMNVDVSKNPPKITFFDPQDNKKETVLNEKKASEIKKKRQYKKKKK